MVGTKRPDAAYKDSGNQADIHQTAMRDLMDGYTLFIRSLTAAMLKAMGSGCKGKDVCRGY